jgi:FdhD protein
MSTRALTPAAPALEVSSLDRIDCPGLRWEDGTQSALRERLVVEEPLAIEISYERLGQAVRRVLAVTMRTPGQDADLALGFLYCESVVDRVEDVIGAEPFGENVRGEKIPTWSVRLARPPRGKDVERVSRGIITSAACGLCGRTSLQGLRMMPESGAIGSPAISGAAIVSMTGKLRQRQAIYPETGGCHGAGLFDEAGEPLIVCEDVGRHNAVDKVIGAALRGAVPTAGRTLVLSGRAGFELVQKAAAAGVALVVAVGAPSSFAVRLARDAGITLAGFARDGRFNIYSQSGRLIRD